MNFSQLSSCQCANVDLRTNFVKALAVVQRNTMCYHINQSLIISCNCYDGVLFCCEAYRNEIKNLKCVTISTVFLPDNNADLDIQCSFSTCADG